MHVSPSTCVAFDADGNLYSAGYDSRLIAWDKTFRQPKWVAEHDELINSIEIVDGRVFTASADRSACIWDLKTGSKISTIAKGHKDALNILTVSPAGDLVAIGGEEGLVWLYHTDSSSMWARSGGETENSPNCIDPVSFIRPRAGQVRGAD